MLDILVRQVTGGGEGEMLTPDVNIGFNLYVFLTLERDKLTSSASGVSISPSPPQMADDFVDEVVTQACRLAKLRPSSTLELRDIQLFLPWVTLAAWIADIF
jgi:transcription initiation factor TFIID subunit 12